MRILLLAACAASVLASAQSAAQVQIRMRSDYEAGVRAYESGNLKMAITFFTQGADKGDPQSEFALGTHYAFGEGVPEDLGKAKGLVESSARKGYPPAITFLGIMHQRGRGTPVDHAKAVEHFRKAALLCQAQAQNLLARALYDGEGAARNKPEALAWLLFAADLGEKEARTGVEMVGAELGPKEQDEARARYTRLKQQIDCKTKP